MTDRHSENSPAASDDDEYRDVPVSDPDPDAAAKADEEDETDRSRLADDDPNRAW